MRSVPLALALTLLAAPAVVAQQTTAASGPTPGEVPAVTAERTLPEKQADTRPVRAEAQQVKTEKVEVAARQEVRGNAFYLIGIAVVIVAVIALLAAAL